MHCSIVTLWIQIVTSSQSQFVFEPWLTQRFWNICCVSFASIQLCKLWFRCQVNTMDKWQGFIYRAGLVLDLFACNILACAELYLLATCIYTCDFCWVVLRILRKPHLMSDKDMKLLDFFLVYPVWDDVFGCHKPRVFNIEKEILKRLYSWNSQICYPKYFHFFQSSTNQKHKESK